MTFSVVNGNGGFGALPPMMRICKYRHQPESDSEHRMYSRHNLQVWRLCLLLLLLLILLFFFFGGPLSLAILL